MPDIYVDSDSCPVKEEVIRVAGRYELQVYMVSNHGSHASVGPNLHPVLVGQEWDAADNWIVEHIAAADIAITADIPLAARCLEKGASVISPAGHLFTPQNIGSAMAARALNAYLREAGEMKGYSGSFAKRDRSRFLQALDTVIQKLRR